MSQVGLEQFGGPGERPSDEAEAVAGSVESGAGVVVDEETAGLPDARGSIEFAVHQVNYTVEGYGSEEEPLIHVFGRTEDRESVHVTVRGFRPYFYAPTAEVSQRDLEADAITGSEEGFVSIRDEPLTRIYARTPRDVGQIRDRFRHFEADVPFPSRFLIDKGIRSGIRVPERRRDGTLVVDHREVEPVDLVVTPRVHMVDIEVDDRSGFPEDGEEPILCLAAHDSYRDEYVAWLYVAPDGAGHRPEELADHRLLDGSEIVQVRCFDEEAEMLDDYIDYVAETGPDLASGWNIDDFDAPYLLDRMERLDPHTDIDLSIERLSPIGEVWRDNWRGPNIKGLVVFDLLYGYRRTQFTELDSYRLDAVAEEELGESKERYTGAIGDLWEQNPERLLEYNVRDVELCVEIDRKQEVIAFWNEVRTFVGCKLEDAPTPGDTVDVYILHKVHGEFVLPSKGQVEGEQYEGGAVFDAISGVREMVSVLDLACFSGDTQLLTPHGVRNIKDIEVDDEIYTLNPETFECEIQRVEATHAYENSYGRLHHISGTTHDLKVTENHRFLVSNVRGWDDHTPDDFSFQEYRDITSTERFAFPSHGPIEGEKPETFRLVDEVKDGHVVLYSSKDLRAFRNRMPISVQEELRLIHGSSLMLEIERKAGKYLVPVETYREHSEIIDQYADNVYLKYDAQHRETPLAFEMEDWLEFVAWFVTEGSIQSDGHTVNLHQKDPEGREAIRDLLDRMNLNYSVDGAGFYLSNRILQDWLHKHCGKGFANKRLPPWIFELDASLIEIVLETMIEGDGQWSIEGLGKFWTRSDQLKQDIARCAVHCGEKPTVTKQCDGTWYISVGKRGSFCKSDNESIEEHSGSVYCITAEENNVVLAGRNGHFQWVGQSLYPMCMITVNASPETKVDPAEYDGETYRAPNGTCFRKKPDGIIREMVDELLIEREEKKGLRDGHEPGSGEYQRFDRQQQAVKVLMNSLYGTLGWDRFRLYDREMGAAVTATGRAVLQFTEKSANRVGYQVVYGDTDSVMLELGPDVDKSEAIDRSIEIADHINDSYDEFALKTLNAATHRFEIEFEKLYRRFFQAGKKKRYAGHAVWKDGKDIDEVDIVGFEYQRSDIAQITKRVQLAVIDMIVTGDELEADLERVKAFLVEEIEAFLAGDVDVDEIGIPGGIGKHLDNYESDPAHVRGAKYANQLLGTNFGRGSKPKRYYLKGVHPEFFREVEAERGLDPRRDPVYGEFKRDPDVICVEFEDQLPEAFEIDYEKMLEKTLQGPISRVLTALDLSWEEIKSGQQQTGLGQFS